MSLSLPPPPPFLLNEWLPIGEGWGYETGDRLGLGLGLLDFLNQIYRCRIVCTPLTVRVFKGDTSRNNTYMDKKQHSK